MSLILIYSLFTEENADHVHVISFGVVWNKSATYFWHFTASQFIVNKILNFTTWKRKMCFLFIHISFRAGWVISNNLEKGPHLAAISWAGSWLLLRTCGEIKGWLSNITSVSYAMGLDAAKWRGVSPPWVVALTSAPQSSRRVTHWLLFHLEVECKGCQSWLVRAEISAPCSKSSLAMWWWFS